MTVRKIMLSIGYSQFLVVVCESSVGDCLEIEFHLKHLGPLLQGEMTPFSQSLGIGDVHTLGIVKNWTMASSAQMRDYIKASLSPSLKDVVLPAQTTAAPEIGPGIGFTVTVTLVRQPVVST